MKLKISLLLLISFYLLFIGCEDKKNSINSNIKNKPIQQTKQNSQQSNSNYLITLNTSDNKKIQIKRVDNKTIFKDYENKIILLNFFATWCRPCKVEIPHLNALRKVYIKDFEIISVLLEKNKSQEFINSFIKHFKVTYPVTNGPENIQLAKSIGGIKSIPTMFMYDKNGNQIEKFKGIVSPEILEKYIKNNIKKK